MHGKLKDVVQQTVVDNDAEEGSGGQYRIDAAKSAVIDPPRDICCEEIIEDAVVLTKKNISDNSWPSKALKRSSRNIVGSTPCLMR